MWEDASVRRLGWIDYALLITATVMFGSVYTHIGVHSDRLTYPPYIRVVASEMSGGVPTVSWFDPGAIATGALEVGDRLLQLGDRDLSGVGPVRFWAYYLSELYGRELAPLVVERGHTQ